MGTELDLARRRVHDLRELLTEANRLYHQDDNPTLADAEYDRLIAELRDLEDRHPELDDPNSITKRVGAPPKAGFGKHAHAAPMLSLENVFDDGELNAWAARLTRQLESEGPSHFTFCAEPKLDGISISLTYEHGRLVRALTRGDGETGEDVTDNVRTIRSLPLQLDGTDIPERMEIRGEVYVLKSDFERFNRTRTAEEGLYANPRNFAGGSLRQLDSSITKDRPLSIALYALGDPAALHVPTQTELLARLQSLGLPVADSYSRACASLEDVRSHYDHLKEARAKIPFEVDGMVVKVNEIGLWKALGQRSRTPRYAVAWKFPAQEEATVLLDIQVFVGRTGALTPVAVLKPVTVGGVTVSSASLHNQDEINRLDAQIGDWVLVQRAGDVIPKITKVFRERRTGNEIPFSLPSHCPACNSPVLATPGEVVIRCKNRECPAQVKGRILHFASQDALDIQGLGEKLVDQLVDQGLVKSPADLFKLKREQLLLLPRMGEKSADKLLQSIESRRTTTLARLCFGLGIRHVGQVVAETLATHLGSLGELLTRDLESLKTIPDVGEIVAESIVAWRQEPAHQSLIQDLEAQKLRLALPATTKDGAAGPLTGHVAVVTGTLPTLSRKAATELLKTHGAIVGSGVSKVTTFLLAGEDAGSKLKKAQELGLPILDEQQVLQWINSRVPPAEVATR